MLYCSSLQENVLASHRVKYIFPSWLHRHHCWLSWEDHNQDIMYISSPSSSQLIPAWLDSGSSNALRSPWCRHSFTSRGVFLPSRYVARLEKQSTTVSWSAAPAVIPLAVGRTGFLIVGPCQSSKELLSCQKQWLSMRKGSLWEVLQDVVQDGSCFCKRWRKRSVAVKERQKGRLAKTRCPVVNCAE